MAKGDNYEYLNIRIDTREKDTEESRKKSQDRMTIVRDFFESKGSLVERKKVDYCDYAINGIFIRDEKEYPVNLGIQYKTLGGDMFPSMPTLPEVLFRSYGIFKSVGLVVEENGSYDIAMDLDGCDGLFQNPASQAISGKSGIGLYSSYSNFMQAMASCGVQTRAIRSSSHFPMTIVAILKYITKPIHEGLYIRPRNQEESLINSLGSIEGIGAGNAYKMLPYISNLSHLCSLREDELQKIVGLLTGKKLYAYLHDTSRKDICFGNWMKLDLPLDKRIDVKPRIKSKILSVKEDTSKVNKDLLDFIRESPKSYKDVQNKFLWNEMKTFDELMKLKNKNKIWKNEKTTLWEFGSDKNEIPVKATEEINVGV